MTMKPQIPNFLDLLEEVVQEEDKKKSDAPRELRHYPSSASMVKSNGSVVGACLRALYYRATNESESDPRDLTKKLQAGFGQACHDFLLKKWQLSKKMKVIPESAGRVLADPLGKEISFRLDGLVTHKGELGGLEIKTMQSFGLQSMVKEGGPPDSHLLQVISYFGTNDTIRWFALVYFSRDTGYRAEYHVYKNEEGEFVLDSIVPKRSPTVIGELSFGGIVSRWKELEDKLQKKELPKRDFKAVLTKEGKFTKKRTKNHVDYETDKACLYCSWRTKCWESSDAKDFAVKLGE